MIDAHKIRYLIVGGMNTVVGYGLGVAVYKFLSAEVHIFVVGFLANFFAISFSFLTYKTLVFRSRGQWLAEYLRAYVVYGGVALFGIVLLWLFIDKLRLSIWMGQGLVTVLTVVVSYVGHARFTFRANVPVE